jgi:hypothetical protein
MIPAWTMAGVLPPIRPQQPGHSSDRSPYEVGLCDFIEQFAFTPERTEILKGFLDYRAALHGAGLKNGFQWVDGSFMQDVENHETRPPNDVDVVTYFHLPTGETQVSLFAKARNLLSNTHVKATYKVDAYPYVLGEPTDTRQVRQISYWYSMWSHRRDGLWKGFVQINLKPDEDSEARRILSQKHPQETAK